QIGSDFSVGVEPDYTTIGISSLSFNRDQMLKEFTEILTTPTFPSAEIQRQRALALAGLAKLADRPEQFSEYLFPTFMFGKHPYGHEASGTPRSIKAFTREDIVKFYAEKFTPSNSVLAIVGQYDDAWKKKVVEELSKWKGPAVTPPKFPDFPAWKGTELLLVDRTDLNQAQIQIGFKGVPRNIPEYMEMRAALKILGESFGSRLFEEIREKRGLTYHIRAWFDPRLTPGPMGIYTFTRTDKIGETVEETLRIYRDFVANGVTQDEVRDVKALMRGQFPRTFETPESLAQQLLLLDLYGVSPTYLTNYLKNLDAMTRESINAGIRKYFDPTNLKILVYAPRDKAEPTLRKLGKVEVRGYKEFLQ
ncbi:MAG TPA: pitrilysin family protein, partial [Bdellovibrionales bacterium]|nr:pitrilysin family protein [Bdellovibrionales bacterium]